jgi:hypothetical protein
MNNNSKTIAAVVVVGLIALYWYMTPYQQCIRELKAADATKPAARCLKLMSGSE